MCNALLSNERYTLVFIISHANRESNFQLNIEMIDFTLNEINIRFDSIRFDEHLVLVRIDSQVKKNDFAFFSVVLLLILLLPLLSLLVVDVAAVRKWQFVTWVPLLIHPILIGSTSEVDWNARQVDAIWNYDSIYQKLCAISGEWMCREGWVPAKAAKWKKLNTLIQAVAVVQRERASRVYCCACINKMLGYCAILNHTNHWFIIHTYVT